MKKMLLASILVMAGAMSVQAQDYGEGMMSPKQAEYLRYNGVSVNISRVDDRVVSRRATAYYEASLTNPYSRGIRCNIDLTSSRGVNDRYEVIANKSHAGIYVPGKSVTKVCGSIEIKHGRGDDGLQWVESRGHLVRASNCFFVD